MKILNLSVAVIATSALLIGCKAKESTYKAAYEMAQQKELADESVSTVSQSVETATVKEETPQPTTVKVEEPSVKVTVEKVTTVDAGDAAKLKTYNVVVGTFSITTNANSLKNSLISDGYNAFTVQNAKGWYRVVAASFGTREEATSFREAIKQRYAGRFDDAWLLINE